MKLQFALAAIGCLLLTGCCPVLSLNPLATDADSVQDLPLAGVWQDDNDTWVIRERGNGYEIKEDGSEKLTARLVRVGNLHFLDLTSPDSPTLTVGVHLLARVAIQGDRLEIAFFDTEWIREQARKEGLAQTQRGDGEVLFTASTEQLRRFVTKYAGDSRAYSDTEEMRRLR